MSDLESVDLQNLKKITIINQIGGTYKPPLTNKKKKRILRSVKLARHAGHHEETSLSYTAVATSERSHTTTASQVPAAAAPAPAPAPAAAPAPAPAPAAEPAPAPAAAPAAAPAPLVTPAPEEPLTTRQIALKTKYDQLIIGMGAAACVIAARCAQAGYKVLMIDQGPNNGLTSKDPDVQGDLPFINLPIGVFTLYERYRGTPFMPSSTLLSYVGRQEDENSYASTPRSQGPGGCTNHNAMQDGIGPLAFYDALALGVKDPYFNGINANTLFKRMENYQAVTNYFKNPPKVGINESSPTRLDTFNQFAKIYQDAGDPAVYSGQTGWLKIQYGTPHDIQNIVLDEVTKNPTLYGNTPGVILRKNASGIGLAGMQANSKVNPDGSISFSRSYGYADLIEPAGPNATLAEKAAKAYTENITLLFDSYCTKLIFEDPAQPTACTGCEILHKRGANKSAPLGTRVVSDDKGRLHTEFREVQPKWNTLTAEQQSIASDLGWTRLSWNDANGNELQLLHATDTFLCCGTIQSPQIAMLSGIGPAEHLKTMGIPVLVDSPGVGSNFTDHTEVTIVSELNPRKVMHPWQAGFIYGAVDNPRPDWYLPPPTLGEVSDVDRTLNGESIDRALAASSLSFGENSGVITWDYWSEDRLIYKPEVRNALNEIVEEAKGEVLHDIHCAQWDAFFVNFEGDINTRDSFGDFIDESKTLAPETHGFWKRNMLPSIQDPLVLDPKRLKSTLNNSQYDGANPRVFVTWLLELMTPTEGKTNGTIRLKSTDPTDQPIIDEKLYDDERGLERMANFVINRLRPMMDRIQDKIGIQDVDNEDPNLARRYEVVPGRACDTVEKLKQYIKNDCYGHHMSGTMQMGPGTAAEGDVVNSHFQVNGTTHLYSADCGSYRAPILHGYNTSRGGYYMGEACADRYLHPKESAPFEPFAPSLLTPLLANLFPDFTGGEYRQILTDLGEFTRINERSGQQEIQPDLQAFMRKVTGLLSADYLSKTITSPEVVKKIVPVLPTVLALPSLQYALYKAATAA